MGNMYSFRDAFYFFCPPFDHACMQILSQLEHAAVHFATQREKENSPFFLLPA